MLLGGEVSGMEENNANVSTNLIPKSSMNYFYARLRAKNTNELDHPGFKFPSRLRINNDNPGLRLRKRTGVCLYRRRRSKKMGSKYNRMEQVEDEISH